MDRSSVRLLASALFLAIAVIWIYWSENQGPDHSLERTLPDAVQFAAWFGSYALMGFFVGRWWAIPLAFLPILLAIPAGGSQLDEDRMAISQMLLATTPVVGAPLTALGWLAAEALRPHHPGSADQPAEKPRSA